MIYELARAFGLLVHAARIATGEFRNLLRWLREETLDCPICGEECECLES